MRSWGEELEAMRTVRTGAGAAVGVVSKLVDVHAPLGGGVIALQIIRYSSWAGFG